MLHALRQGKKALLAVLLAALTTAAAQAAEPVVTLKMGFVDPITSIFAQGGEAIAREVEKSTGGKIKIEVYAGAQLGSERDMYEGSQIGSIDICTVVNTVLSSFIPELTVLDQPFLFDSVDQALGAIDGKLGTLVADKARGQGVHIVGWLVSGFRNVFSNRPITKVEDFKGLKIRTMENQMQIATFNALGAIATPMAASEQFTALQQGTIDACENAVANMKTNRYYEVIKNVTFTNHLYTYIAVGLSDKAYRSIPADLMPQFMEGVRKGIAYERQLLLDENAASIKELSENEGVKYHEIDRDAIKALVMPALKPFQDKMNKEWLAAVEEAKKQYK